MARPPLIDPRPMAPAEEEDVRPVIALPRRGASPLIIAVAAVAAALLLFAILEARRRTASAPTLTMEGAETVAASPPPPLYLPPEPPPAPAVVLERPAPQAEIPRAPPVPVRPPPPQVVYVPQGAPAPAPPPERVSGGPALVVDTTTGGTTGVGQGAPGGPAPGAPGGGAAAGAAPGGAVTLGTRARAGVLANRATTVPQGMLIAAVLETALDSTRPGLARAIVSHDVRGFDGSRVLIPRGSRLIGEYRSDLAQGQKRALVNWDRLIRPDGVTIAIGSPAADQLGRSGVKGNLNTHFLQRFANAILTSSVDIALALTTRSSDRLVVVPGSSLSTATSGLVDNNIQPTLTVRPAARISIFVARDLDFTGVERRR